jgi:hypothetical protein
MEPDRSTDPALADVLDALRRREPIFHPPQFNTSRADAERQTALAFWEVGASGRRYSRAYVLDELDRRREAGEVDAPLHADDFRCQALAPELYLLTYTLAQGTRRTRRTTLWRRSGGDWQAVFHQGTVIQDD